MNYNTKLLLAFSLVREKSSCDWDNPYQGKQNKQDCAAICKKTSIYFVIARQDSGYCDSDKCMCYCLPGLQKGRCTHKYKGNDDLYIIR